MRKLLFLFMTLPILMCSQACTLPDCLSEANMVKAYQNGQEISMEAEQHSQFLAYFNAAISDCREAPAFCVSLHDNTMKEFETGIWIKFIFSETQVAQGMPFDSLLMHIEKDSSGVNLMRGNQDVYNGRCFYLDLQHNFNELYDYLLSLPTVEKEQSEDLPEVELESSEPSQETFHQTGQEDEPNEDDSNDVPTGAMPSVPDESEKENSNGVITQKPQEESTKQSTEEPDGQSTKTVDTETTTTSDIVELRNDESAASETMILKAVDAEPIICE